MKCTKMNVLRIPQYISSNKAYTVASDENIIFKYKLKSITKGKTF